jgi:hypothetical protein
VCTDRGLADLALGVQGLADCLLRRYLGRHLRLHGRSGAHEGAAGFASLVQLDERSAIIWPRPFSFLILILI